MADKTFIVCEDMKYTGKHRVYKAGQEFSEREIFGDNAQLAIKEGKIELKGRSKKADK